MLRAISIPQFNESIPSTGKKLAWLNWVPLNPNADIIMGLKRVGEVIATTYKVR